MGGKMVAMIPTDRDAALQRELSWPTREYGILAGKQLLTERCAFLGLREVEMKDDGNCQFRALSQELYGTQQHHVSVRSQVLSHMQAHAEDYAAFFVSSEWEGYLSAMNSL